MGHINNIEIVNLKKHKSININNYFGINQTLTHPVI